MYVSDRAKGLGFTFAFGLMFWGLVIIVVAVLWSNQPQRTYVTGYQPSLAEVIWGWEDIAVDEMCEVWSQDDDSALIHRFNDLGFHNTTEIYATTSLVCRERWDR